MTIGRESDWADQEDQGERNEGQIDITVSHPPILSSLLLLLKHPIYTPPSPSSILASKLDDLF